MASEEAVRWKETAGVLNNPELGAAGVGDQDRAATHAAGDWRRELLESGKNAIHWLGEIKQIGRFDRFLERRSGGNSPQLERRLDCPARANAEDRASESLAAKSEAKGSADQPYADNGDRFHSVKMWRGLSS